MGASEIPTERKDAMATERFIVPPERGGILPEDEGDWKPRNYSANGFRHEDVVAGDLNGDIGGERGGAGFEVAKMAIEGGEGVCVH